MVHGRFAHCADLGVKICAPGMFEISEALYLDTHRGLWKPEWLLVRILHNPSRKLVAPDVCFLTQIVPARADGASAGPVIFSRPNMTREEILAAYAEQVSRTPEAAYGPADRRIP